MNWQKITSRGLKREHYTADALIVYCVDNRGKDAFDGFLAKKKFKNYDLIMIPGGAKSIADPRKGAEWQTVTVYIKKLVELHKAKIIVLTTHIDCGACGGSAAFDNNTEAELKVHGQWLKIAQESLSKQFPDIPIEIYFIDFDGFWQIP